MLIAQSGLVDIWGFLSEKRQREAEDRERKYIAEKIKTVGVFSDATKWAKELPLCGRSFSQYVKHYSLFPVEPCRDMVGGSEAQVLRWLNKSQQVLRSDCGRYVYAEIVIPAKTPLALLNGMVKTRVGYCFFDTAPVVPALYEIEDDGAKVWMSMTPNELMTQRSGIQAAKGDVVVGGLGLGYLLRQIAAKKAVKSITVIEISQSLADWYGHRLCAELAQQYNKPIILVVGDVFDHMSSGSYNQDVHWSLDVWPSYPTDWFNEKQERALLAVRNLWGWGVSRTCLAELRYRASRTSRTR